MPRNNERHMVTLRLLTRIIIAGIDYMPFRAVNSVNHERIYDTIRDREHIEAGNASSKMQQVRPRIRLDKRIVKILILAGYSIFFFFFLLTSLHMCNVVHECTSLSLSILLSSEKN